MSWKHRDAKSQARQIRRTLGVPYDQMYIVWWFGSGRQGSNVMTRNKLVGARGYTTKYLLAKGARVKTKPGWEREES